MQLSSLITDYKLTDGSIIRDLSSELAKLKTSYNAALQSRNEIKEQLAREISDQLVTKWELEHQTRRNKDYEKQIEKLQMDIAALKSHIPMLSKSLFLYINIYA